MEIRDNTDQITNNITQKSNIFLRLMADKIVNISTPKTPKKTGRLRMDINKQVLGLNGKIKWGKGYAKIQEVKQFKNYTTPGTGPHFAENAVNEGVKETSKIAKQAGLI